MTISRTKLSLVKLFVEEQGMMTFYVQHDKPETAEQQRNWLPAPDGPFRFAARFYGPKAPLMDGSYAMPALVRQAQ